MFINKYWDKVFSTMEEMDKKEKPKQREKVRERKYCNSFIKGEGGFCKHYMGCRIDIVSCARECSRE